MPLWQLLLRHGLATSERAARALIMSGQVLVDDHPVDKPGAMLAAGAVPRVRGARVYASRGGEKLAHALSRFGIRPGGRVALDAGASTGGFTDCLLVHGAARVYAVDVGYGQLLGRLRQDSRVVNLERTNLGTLAPGDLKPPPDLATLDLSYLPLLEAWRVIQPLLAAASDIVSLVKPLFEVDDPAARRSGVIADPGDYLRLLARLRDGALAMGWSPVAFTPSPLRGSSGTVEFLAHLRNLPHAGALLPLEPVVAAALTPEA